MQFADVLSTILPISAFTRYVWMFKVTIFLSDSIKDSRY